MELWGLKTIAWFDVWSIEHFVSGMNLYFFTRYSLEKKNLPASTTTIFGWVMAICFAWEALEHYLEIGLAGAKVEHWLQGVEYAGNRLITDPALIFIGAWVAHKQASLVMFAKLFSLAWLVVHIFVFPDSMYLQHML